MQSESLAIDNGNNALAFTELGLSFPLDQRGEPRIQFGTIDIGAFEVQNLDFGDAPASFPTLLSEDGARHRPTGPRLGNTRDNDVDGQPSGLADGDGSDEDGVMFGTLALGNSMAGVNIDLQNSTNALVDAWIDFDGNGVWESDEQILDSQAVIAGLQTLNLNIPSDAVVGDTYARVRVSSAGGLEVNGEASDGEVEDYLVTIVSGSPSVVDVQVNGGEAQRSMVTELEVTFDREVNASAAAFSIVDRDTLTEVENLVVSSAVVEGVTRATIQFETGNLVDSRENGMHTLADGNYQLMISGSQIVPVGGGAAMSADVLFGDQANDSFFRLLGDTDGDRDVDGQDYGRFGLTFLKSDIDAAFNDRLDSDGDGDVDGQDYGRFGLRFLQSLPF